MLEELKKIVIKYDLVSRSFEYFWESFEDYQVEDTDEFVKNFGEFSNEELTLDIKTIAYKLSNWPDNVREFIVVHLEILYQKKYKGYYDAIYDIEGNDIDDFLVFF